MTALEVALTLFQQRCAVAGERIYKTVENVDGVYLLRLRSPLLNFASLFRLADPYETGDLGEVCIDSFHQASHELRAVVERLKGDACKPVRESGMRSLK